ncbi:MAG: MarR family transcriptional regulator [Planctomycetes bacterium]|nr:MarR family transcriptional regulator [Planctomycetota bacterium]
MLEYDFEESVGCWVATTSHALRRALDVELAREGITFRQWEVLAWLACEGGLSQSELAERMSIEAPTLAGILARMERDGWLDRESCPDDRRKKRIRVSHKAEAVWERMVACCRRVREQATRGIPAGDLAFFKETCARIRENLGVTTGPGSRLAEAHASN